MEKRMSKRKWKDRSARVCATADPDLVVRVIDSGYNAEEWAQITEAMRRYVPNGDEANVSRRFEKLLLEARR
jgi:hypothetical protein